MLQVLEEKPSGLLIASLQAKDPDEGENGTIIYSLIGMNSRTGTPMLLCLADITRADGCPLPGIPTPTPTPTLLHPALPSLCHAAPSRVSLSLQEPGQSVSLCTWPPGSCGQPRFCAAPTVPNTSSLQWPATGVPRPAARQPSSVSRYSPPPGPVLQLLLSLCHLPLAWPLGRHHPATWQPFSPPPHPLPPSSLGTLSSCSAVDPALKPT